MNKNHIGSIERYHEYEKAIKELIASVLTGIAEEKLLGSEQELMRAMCDVTKMYPFIELIYTLDPAGCQNSGNVSCFKKSVRVDDSAKRRDRSRRPYFLMVKDSATHIVTDPYLSNATGKLCVSAAQQLCDSDGKMQGYLVLDIDLTQTIGFLMGDASRTRFIPIFSVVYSIIAAGLFLVVAALLFLAGKQLFEFIAHDIASSDIHIKPFSVIIYLTLGLAIFDLAKTILEEEVLMHKDIFRHSSTRRTITRFIAAILIAVSIEALLYMFKSALGDDSKVYSAVMMMATAIGLLVGLGIYVYLGAKAERIMMSMKKKHSL